MRNKEQEKVGFEGSSSSTEQASKNLYLPKEVYHYLPEPLKEITGAFNERREKDIVLLSSLGALSACLPNVTGLYANETYSPNLFVFIVAPAASGKGVMNWAKKLVEPIHAEILNESKRKIQEYKNAPDNNGIAEPKLQIKLVPGNTSSSKFYTHLERAENDLIIFESEADTLSNMLKQDWGNFSDLLRKAFHHETVSISRSTEDRYFEISNPKVSIVISGTPDQVKPLIESKENGLFSRFLYYNFEGVNYWKDVSPKAYRISYDSLMNQKGIEIKELYYKLKNLKSVEIKMTDEQWDLFQSRMALADELIIKTGKEEFSSIVKRLGLISFRMINILTVLENKNTLEDDEIVLQPSDNIVRIVMEMTKILVEHSLQVFDKFEKNVVQLTMKERDLLSKLPEQFKRMEGLQIANSIGIPARTFDDVLKKWTSQKILQKESYGQYVKVKTRK